MGKSKDGWICLESLLWMSLIWWFVWSVLGVFPKILDPDLDLPNVCASNFNTIPGVSAVHLTLLLNRSYEALSTDHCWNGTWLAGSMLKSQLLIHVTGWLHWSCWIQSFGVGGQSVWGKKICLKPVFWRWQQTEKASFPEFGELLLKCQNQRARFKGD